MAKKAATAKTEGSKGDGTKAAAPKAVAPKAAASKAAGDKAAGDKASASKATASKTETASESQVSKPAKTSAAKEAGSAKAAAGKAPVLLTLTDIGDHLASTFDMPKSHAKIYLAEAVALIGKNLKKGNKVRISGLGVFQVKKRAPRKGRNPTTGEAIKIKATKRVGFAVARDLKAKL